MPAALTHRRIALAVAVVAAAHGARAEEAAETAIEHATAPRQCFSTTQTRQQIEARGLTDPFACMRAAAHEHGGEAISVRLCRLDDLLIYEISVLRHDGRIVRPLFDAVTGRPHSGRKSN